MSENEHSLSKKPEFKYKIGRVKQRPTVQKDEHSGLTFIELKASPDEKVYGCTKFAGHYKEEKKLGQGTFGEVYKGIHLETQRQVAMKRIIVNVEKDLFPITAHREITILRRLNHKNVIKLIEMVYDYPPDTVGRTSQEAQYQASPGKPSLMKSFYMVLPYMVSDLSGILHNPRINLSLGDIKCIILQLLESLNYIHCQKFMHRDIKTANILIDHDGVVKLADFGLARLYYGAPPTLDFPGGAGSGAKYTSVVVTRWYRAPELVLGDKFYTTAVDIWGVGCVFAECFEKKPVLQGSTDVDQGHVIFKLLGTPTEEQWPLAYYLPGAELTRTNYPGTVKERFGKHLSDMGLDFLKNLLSLDPYKRLTAMSAMKHPFFTEEPLPREKLVLPCEESHEADIKRYKEEMHQAMSQKVPSAPRGHGTESDLESGPLPIFPRAPRPKPNFPTGPAAGSRRIPSGGNLSRNQPPSYNRHQHSRFNYKNNNINAYGGVNKQPHANIPHRSRYYNSRYGNNNNINGSNNNGHIPTGPQQALANSYQHRNGQPYQNTQQPSRYQGTNERFQQQQQQQQQQHHHHHSRDGRGHNHVADTSGDNNNVKNPSQSRMEEVKPSRPPNASAPLPRGPATTQLSSLPSTGISTSRESLQPNRPQQEQQNSSGQDLSKNENGSTDNNKKDIADLY